MRAVLRNNFVSNRVMFLQLEQMSSSESRFNCQWKAESRVRVSVESEPRIKVTWLWRWFLPRVLRHVSWLFPQQFFLGLHSPGWSNYNVHHYMLPQVSNHLQTKILRKVDKTQIKFVILLTVNHTIPIMLVQRI